MSVVGPRVDALVILSQHALLLQGVAVERIVGEGSAEAKAIHGPLPSEFSEHLTNVRMRIGSPSVFTETISRCIPVPSGRVGAAIFELHCPPNMASTARF